MSQEAATKPTLFVVETPPGSEYSSCQGQFSYDPTKGYAGHYFLDGYAPRNPGPWFFDVPENLTKPFITIKTEDGHYATICFIRIGQRSWRNMNSLRVDFVFPYLLNKVGVTDDEESVSALIVNCPTLSSIVGVRPVTQSFDLPNTGGTAIFTLTKKEWPGTSGTIEIGDRRQIGGSPDSSEVHFRSDICFTLRYTDPQKPTRVLHQLRAIDDFFSVLAGGYVQIKGAWLEVLIDDDGNQKKEEFQLSGYGAGNQVAEFIGPHDAICQLSLDADWSKLLEGFLAIWERNEVSFKWFRSSQINRRYIEEQFSYAVRLVELFFKSSPERDPEAERAVATILQRAEEDPALIEFVRRRLAPIVNNAPSLTSTLRTLYGRYPEIRAFSKTRPQDAVRLRGKEMHGADANYSGEEYGEMYALTRSFMLAFRLAILEECGLDRVRLLERISRTRLRDLLVST